MNNGKRFEQNFKKSVPINIFYYRFKDGTASWGGSNENVRFQAKNMCDCMLFTNDKLFLLELKSHKGKSLPLSCIRDNQIEELQQTSQYKNIVAGVIVEFSDIKEYYFLEINQLLNYSFEFPNKKSVPIKYFQENAIIIEHIPKKVNVWLDIQDFVNKF